MIAFKQITAVETSKLRLEVLKTCEEYEYKYQGDFDKNTIHLAAFKSNNLIGIVSLMKTSNNSFKGKQMQLRGMAIQKSYQGKNIGAKLINKCVLFCSDREINLIWCNAREESVDFYKKQGFEIHGESFHIKNVGTHYLMSFNL